MLLLVNPEPDAPSDRIEVLDTNFKHITWAVDDRNPALPDLLTDLIAADGFSGPTAHLLHLRHNHPDVVVIASGRVSRTMGIV